MRRVLMLGGVLMLLVVGVLAVARQQEPLPQWVYFEQGTQLHRVSWDGTHVESLPLSDIMFHGISPDGHWLLYSFPWASELYISRPDLTQQRLILGEVNNAAWSPDGTKIAATSGYELIIVDIQSDRRRTIPFPEPQRYGIQWSPDGEWIMFAGHPSPVEDFFLVNIVSLEVYDHNGDNVVLESVWSPDSTWIVYSDFYQGDIFKMRLDGSDKQNLTNSEQTRDGLLGWNYDTGWLIYSSDGQIFRMRPDGNDVHSMGNISPIDVNWYGPWMIYSDVDNVATSNLFRFNLETEEMVRLTNSDWHKRYPYAVPPTDLNWHSETLAIGAAIALGVAAITKLRRKRVA